MSAEVITTAVGPRDHVVHFYAADDELVERVTNYLAEGLRAGAPAVIIGTAAHRSALKSALEAAGVDVAEAQAAGLLSTLDAADTLAEFMTDDGPDPFGFDAIVGDTIRAAARRRGGVRAFGEMVSLLWEAGDVRSALELELLWNELGRSVEFSLYCAYTSHAVADADHADALYDVCHLHSAVVGRHEESAEFDASLGAIRAARTFVTETLRRWGHRDLLDDGRLVVTELATNAVKHASSAFAVTLSRREGAVIVAVRDDSPLLPQPADAAAYADSGRGLALVAALARGWGFDRLPDSPGKVVWAELRA